VQKHTAFSTNHFGSDTNKLNRTRIKNKQLITYAQNKASETKIWYRTGFVIWVEMDRAYSVEQRPTS